MAQIGNKPFKDRAVDTVSALGSFLIAHAEDVVGDISGITEIEISMKIQADAKHVSFPEIRVSHGYFDRQAAEAFLGKQSKE